MNSYQKWIFDWFHVNKMSLLFIEEMISLLNFLIDDKIWNFD